MAAGKWFGIAALCVGVAWPPNATRERSEDASLALVEAIRALAYERAAGGRMELRATCERGGAGSVQLSIEYPDRATPRTEVVAGPSGPEARVPSQVVPAAAPEPRETFLPPSARRALDEVLNGIAALGEEAARVRVSSLVAKVHKERRGIDEGVRVTLDLELPAPSLQVATERYLRLRELWRAAESLVELDQALLRPLGQERGVAIDGLVFAYAWPRDPLATAGEGPGPLELFVRTAADAPQAMLGDLSLFPRVQQRERQVVDRCWRIEPEKGRTYPLERLQFFLGRLEGGGAGVRVTELHLQRTPDDRWRFEAEVTRRERDE